LARSYINLGSVMRRQKALIKGRTPYQQAILHLEQLCERYPNFAEYQYELAKAHTNLGNLFGDGSQLAEAKQQYQLAEATYLRLVAQHPGIPQFRQSLANTYNSLAVVSYKLNEIEETRQAWNRSQAQLEVLVEKFPNVPDYHGDLGMIRGNLGYWELRENNPSAAIDHLEAAVPELQIALNANFNHPDYSAAAKKVCRDLVKALVSTEQSDQALGKVENLLDQNPLRPVNVWLAAVLMEQITKAPEQGSLPREPEFSENIRRLANRILENLDALPGTGSDFRSKPEFEALRNLPLDCP
jgi:tetratricopeptide (TPR) repeat protein